MKKKKKKRDLKKEFINYLKDEWKFLLFCVVLTSVLLFPVDYYITTGGGVSNIDKRVIIEDSYKSKGTLNISYVTQLKGDILTYGLSYIMPHWEREKYNDYKIDKDEKIEDFEFRNKLNLDYSNSNATYWGYKLANQDIKLISSKTYIVYVFKEYNTDLKVQDELLSINDKHYNSILEYRDYLNSLNERDIVKIKVLRKKKKITIDSKLYRVDNRNILGVSLTTINKYDTSKKIVFKFKGNETGPSGGLMTTLDIYNKLTEKDITNGLTIAGTGTIEADGTIGEIGGVNYKVLGAFQGKADVFLVPKENYKECMKVVKKNKLKIKIISVSNIEEAIEKLSNLER